MSRTYLYFPAAEAAGLGEHHLISAGMRVFIYQRLFAGRLRTVAHLSTNRARCRASNVVDVRSAAFPVSYVANNLYTVTQRNRY